MEITRMINDPGMLMKADALTAVSEGLRTFTGMIADIQKQKTARTAIRTAGEITLEHIRSNLMTNIDLIRADCVNRENTLKTLTILMADKASFSGEELDMVLNFLLKVGLSRLDLALPNIDQALRLISCPLQDAEEVLE